MNCFMFLLLSMLFGNGNGCNEEERVSCEHKCACDCKEDVPYAWTQKNHQDGCRCDD